MHTKAMEKCFINKNPFPGQQWTNYPSIFVF